MSIPMDNIGNMGNSNQMQGSNAIAGLRLGQIAARRKARSKSSGGGQQFDKAYFENMAELETHREQLRRTGVESDANVNDLALSRSHGVGLPQVDGANGPEDDPLVAVGGHIGARTTSIREKSRYHDADGNVLGEVPMDDKLMGISTKGMRMPTPAAPAAAPGPSTGPSTGQQMSPVVAKAGMVIAQTIPVLTAKNSALTPGSPGKRSKNKALTVTTGTVSPQGQAAGAALQAQSALQTSQASPTNAGTGRHAKPWSGKV